MTSGAAGIFVAVWIAAADLPAQHPEPDVFPEIREIVFEGNNTTQPKVLLREMYVGVGDPAHPVLIERSRQNILDLGLFRSVRIQEDPVADGVRLTVFVREKIYILPVPRLSANSDGGYSFGMQLRWDNLFGLNQTFTGYWSRMQSEEGEHDGEERGLATRYSANFRYPFVLDRPLDLSIGASHTRTPVTETVTYMETMKLASFTLVHKLSDDPGSSGWRAGGGINYASQDTEGIGAPSPYGRATALLGLAAYSDVHYRIYSDEGQRFFSQVEVATEGVASDYHYVLWLGSYRRFQPVGSKPHQTVHFGLDVAARHGGPSGEEAFELGGSGRLRGFEPETVKGDFVYRVDFEYLRPVNGSSLRSLLVLEAGNAFSDPGAARFDKVLVSAGLGVRWRIHAFVDLELELGVAWPLNGGQPRLFASKV